MVGSDGGIFAYGDAGYYGSPAGIKLAGPVVGIAPSPDGKGYWLAGSDGGIYNYGDAKSGGNCYQFTGGCGTPITGIAGDSASAYNGYWLVGQNGGIFNFNAPNKGSEYNKMGTNAVGIAATGDNNGYWRQGQNGGVFNLGDAGFYGSAYGQDSNAFTGISLDRATGGYWVVNGDGGVFSYNATFHGSAYGAFPYGGSGTSGGLPRCYNKSTICWGLDTAGVQSSVQALQSFGYTPDFVGRYLTSGGGPSPLTTTEVNFFKSNNIPLLLLADQTGGCASTSVGQSEASAAQQAAAGFQVPANGEISILLDIEGGNTPAPSCMEAYADAMTRYGYRPGFYYKPSTAAGPNFCTAAAADVNVQNSLLWSANPQTTNETGPSAAPAYAPALPSCSYGTTGTWQYAYSGGSSAYDTDEMSPSAATEAAAWLP